MQRWGILRRASAKCLGAAGQQPSVLRMVGKKRASCSYSPRLRCCNRPWRSVFTSTIAVNATGLSELYLARIVSAG